ncbi:MAG: hypothetical protein WC980_07730 [Candidatus Brocadiia bacterium]
MNNEFINFESIENSIPPYKAVMERDIDLLLLEEFICSPGFLKFFMIKAKIEITEPIFLGARPHVKTSNGESDLEVMLKDQRGKKLVLLIEDKISADPQPDQAGRYKKRGQSYCREGLCDEVKTIITAPREYIDPETESKFDHIFTYQDFIPWFDRDGDTGSRRAYKKAIVTRAIKQNEEGYNPEADKNVSEFWDNYEWILEKRASCLKLPPRENKPSGSTFIIFERGCLSKNMSIKHKLSVQKRGKGSVDLEIKGEAQRVTLIAKRLDGILPKNACVVPAKKSAAIRIGITKIDPGLPFDQQLKAVNSGIDAAITLYNFAINNHEVFEDILKAK